MKTMIIVLSVAFVAALLPFATAEESCDRAGTTEAIKHPTREDAYLYLDLTHPDKIGEWIESNRAPGLQTIDCMKFGITKYRADTKSDLAP